MNRKFAPNCRSKCACSRHKSKRYKKIAGEFQEMQLMRKHQNVNRNLMPNREVSSNTYGFHYVRRSRRLQEKTATFRNVLPNVVADNQTSFSSIPMAPVFQYNDRPSEINNNPLTSSPVRSKTYKNGLKHSSLSLDINSKFKEKLNVTIVHSALERLKFSIGSKIEEINRALNGEEVFEPVVECKKFKKGLRNEARVENFVMGVPLLPPIKWIYKTPPRQNITVPESSCKPNLKPYVYKPDGKMPSLYQFHNGVYKYVNKLTDQNVPIDTRFMQTISTTSSDSNDAELDVASSNVVLPFRSPIETNDPFTASTRRLQSIFPIDHYKNDDKNEETAQEINASFTMFK